MLISPYQLLEDARKKHYAVGAFNVYNLDTLNAVIKAAEEEHAPAIIQLYTADFINQGRSVFAYAALEAIKKSPVALALHLDHANAFEPVAQAMYCGFNSVMFDGSKMSLEGNISLTKKVVELAQVLKVFTEAEIGPIMRVGEDSDPGQDSLADVSECAELVSRTGVASLAPAIGTAHGIYTVEPKIDFERLAKIKELVQVPLVLHGGSGIPDEMIKQAIALGVLKINFGTMLKHTWSKTMKGLLEQGELEIRKMIPQAVAAVKEVAQVQMRLFGSSGKS